MKKTRKAISALLLAASLSLPTISAQEAGRAANDEFTGHWFIGVKGGIGHTVGETSFGRLISPAASIDFGYQFTPVWGLRAGLSGWQAKGAAVTAVTEVYKFNYLQGNIDVVVDLCGIAGYSRSRAVNPYIFAGVGVNGAFNNDEAQALSPKLPEDNYLWDGSRVFPVGRFGVGMGVRLTDAVHFNIELNGNFLSDRFNSKKASAVDWQLGATAGFTFKIGLKKERSHDDDASAASEPVAQPSQAVDPVPSAEPESRPAEPAARSSVPATVIEAAAFEPVSDDVFFRLNESELLDSERAKVIELAAVLKATPDSRITVTGYADKETGSESYNMELSRKRAENVAAALEAAGIDAGRITVDYKGSTVSPYDTPEKNRVAICVVEK